MVGRCRLGEHADDDPKEAGDLWHPSLRSPEKAAPSLAMTNDLSHSETLRFRLSRGQRMDLDTRGSVAPSVGEDCRAIAAVGVPARTSTLSSRGGRGRNARPGSRDWA
jgi:hypothetical protein